MALTALEIIEKKTGRVHTVHDWTIAAQKAAVSPEKLTDTDLAVIEYFGGAKDALAARYRRSGLTPPHETSTSVEPPQAAGALPRARRQTSEKKKDKEINEILSIFDDTDDLTSDARDRMFFNKRLIPILKKEWDLRLTTSDLVSIFAVIDQIDRKNVARNRKLAALEARLSALERGGGAGSPQTKGLESFEARLQRVEQGGIQYRGVWAEGVRYDKGDFVTWNGGMWACKSLTSLAKPGNGPDAATYWQLAVKAGRDGRNV